MRLLRLLFAVFIFCLYGVEGIAQRSTMIDADWTFVRDGQPAVVVDLPHDWSIQGVPAADEPAGNDGVGEGMTSKELFGKQYHNKYEKYTTLCRCSAPDAPYGIHHDDKAGGIGM